MKRNLPGPLSAILSTTFPIFLLWVCAYIELEYDIELTLCYVFITFGWVFFTFALICKIDKIIERRFNHDKS